MRRELADVVKVLLDTVDEDADITLADSEVDTLLDVANVVNTVSNCR